MYAKLALGNVKKSFRDYAVYFLTLMFGVCIFYVFNSIDGQQAMMVITTSEAKGMEILQRIMGYVSVFVSVILGFLIVYANRFLLRRRKKELAVYQILGMEKGQISRILTIETLLVASASLAVGLSLGILISQGFAVLTASLFEVKLAGFRFVFSTSAAWKAALYFGIAFVLVILFNRVAVGRQKLIDLLYAQRKNEAFRMPHPALSALLFLASLACLIPAYYLVVSQGINLQKKTIFAAFALGGTGTFLFFFSLSGFFLKVVQQSKRVYFKGLNMFVLRQINSRINTAFVSISMVCLILFLSICGLSLGMGLSKSITADLELLHPFDVTYDLYMYETSKESETGETVEEETFTTIDMIAELARVSTPPESYAKSIAQVTFLNLDVDADAHNGLMRGQYLPLSDYNKLLAMQGKSPVTLAEDEFLLNCLNEAHRTEYTAYFKQNKAQVLGAALTLKATDNTVLYNTAAVGTYTCVHILSDSLAAKAAPFISILSINYIEQTAEYRALRQKATDEMLEGLQKRYQTPENNLTVFANATDRLTDFEDSKSTAVTIAYLAVYLGVVFSVISAVVLAITQLSEASDNAYRYGLLRKLGADGKMINQALFRQIAIYFGMPLLLAMVHAIFGLQFANEMIAQMGKSDILRDSTITAFVLLAVYGGYFLATYFGSKRIIGSR